MKEIFDLDRKINSQIRDYEIEEVDLNSCLEKLPAHGDKNDFGRVAIIAGSEKYPGAAALCANAAVRAGAGVVYLYSTAFHQALLPEVIQCRMPATQNGYIANFIDEGRKESFLSGLNRMSAVAIGPGIGTEPETQELLKGLLFDKNNSLSRVPIVLDADALRVVSPKEKFALSDVVLTPHKREFSRITGKDENEIKINDDPLILAKKLNCVVHLKGCPSVSTDGEIRFWNNHGNSGLSTGGSGDVLTGITVAYLGFGIKPIKAIAIASYVHTKTAEIYASEHPRTLAFSASDIIEYLRWI